MLPSDHFNREVLSWFDERGQRYITGEEKADIENQKAESEKQRADAAQKQVELLLANMRDRSVFLRSKTSLSKSR